MQLWPGRVENYKEAFTSIYKSLSAVSGMQLTGLTTCVKVILLKMLPTGDALGFSIGSGPMSGVIPFGSIEALLYMGLWRTELPNGDDAGLLAAKGLLTTVCLGGAGALLVLGRLLLLLVLVLGGLAVAVLVVAAAVAVLALAAAALVELLDALLSPSVVPNSVSYLSRMSIAFPKNSLRSLCTRRFTWAAVSLKGSNWSPTAACTPG